MAIKDWPGGVISKTPVVPAGTNANSAASGVWTLDQVAYWQKQGIWPNPANVGDPYYEYVSLLLTGDGTNGAQNNTFIGGAYPIIPDTVQIKYAKIYSTYSGGARGSLYTVQYSDDNITWTNAFNGEVASSGCGLITGTGGGASSGGHKYWRYVVGAATVSHHPRCSRIALSDGVTDYNLVVFTSDNCADQGEIPAQGYTIGSGTVSITRNGNTTQGSFSPYGNLWSNYFNGAVGTYLSAPSSSNLALGSGDFTVEFWIYALDNGPGDGRIIIDQNVTGSMFWFLQNGVINFRISNVSTPLTAALPATNTWVHVAVARQSGTLRAFINGTLSGYATDNYNYTQNGTYIGVFVAAGEWNMYGYLSNLRIVKGTALYTSNFTPSTTPLTAVSGTSLLTCQSNRFIDNSSNNFTLTVNGNTSVQRFSPFNPTAPYSASTIGGSGYFDGSGDYLNFPVDSAFTLGTNNFTIEGWVYPTTVANGAFSLESSSYPRVLWIYDASAFRVYASTTGSSWQINHTVPIVAGMYNHIVFQRNGNDFRTFLNGVVVATTNSALTFGAQRSVGIVGKGDSGTAWNGYISDMRITNGTAVYSTSGFTPPTAPLTAITNTSLLCNFTNAGIPDAAMMNDLETVGNAQVSTSVKKYGTGSLAFDGTGDWLKTVYSPNLDFGAGDFTAECWVYPTSLATKIILSVNSTGTGYSQLQLATKSDGTWYLLVSTSSGAWLSSTSGGSYSANNWYHVAAVRSGSTFTLYINGSSVLTQSSSSALYAYNSSSYVGTDGSGASAFLGYIDDLRITKGYARYTANFTPPTAAFPTY